MTDRPAIYNHDLPHAQMRSFGMDDFDFETLAAHDERRRPVIDRYVRLMLRVIAMETLGAQHA